MAGLSATKIYEYPNNRIREIEIEPEFIEFEKPTVGIVNTLEITLTARNRDFVVDNIVSGDALFTFSETAFTLQQNVPKIIECYYQPLDSSYIFTDIEIINQVCSKTFEVSGGYPDFEGSRRTIELVEPNGGEIFLAGTDTVIKWRGVSPRKEVFIELSRDEGTTWERLINSATEFEYDWANISGPATDQALIRVGYEIEDGTNDTLGIPEVRWAERYGGTGDENIEVLQILDDGDICIAGFTDSDNFDLTDNAGQGDVFVARVSRNTGELIWVINKGGYSGETITDLMLDDEGRLFAVGTSSSDGFPDDESPEEGVYLIEIDPVTGTILNETKSFSEFFSVSNPQLHDYEDDIVITYKGFFNEPQGPMRGELFCYRVDKNDWDNIVSNKNFGRSIFDINRDLYEDNAVLINNTIYVVNSIQSIGNDFGSGPYQIYLWEYNLESDQVEGPFVFGGGGDEVSYSVTAHLDNIIISGYGSSNNGEFATDFQKEDAMVFSIDSDSKDVNWVTSFGGGERDIVKSVKVKDGYIYVTGNSDSDDGDFASVEKPGGNDKFLAKIDADNGDIIWNRFIGGTGIDSNEDLGIRNNTFYICGSTTSLNLDLEGSRRLGFLDMSLIRLDILPPLAIADTSDAVFSIIEPGYVGTSIDMLDVLVGSLKDSLVDPVISNTIMFGSSVGSVQITGPDADAFSVISGQPPFDLEAMSGSAMEFRFVPTRVGLHTAMIELSASGETVSVPIRGTAIVPALRLGEKILDFGEVQIGTSATMTDTLVFTNNSQQNILVSDVTFDGPDLIQFEVAEELPDQSIAPGGTFDITATFAPRELGLTNGNLTVNVADYPESVPVQLFGIGVELDTIVVDLGRVLVGDTRQLRDSLIFTNRLAEEMVLNFPAFLGPDFGQFTGAPVYFSQTELATGEGLLINVNFTPDGLGERCMVLEIFIDGLEKPLYIKLIGRGVEYEMLLDMRDATAEMGEELDLRIDLLNIRDELGESIDSVQVDISFDKTKLLISDYVAKWDTPRLANYTVKTELQKDDGYYLLAPSKAFLGRVETTEMVIDSASFYSEDGEDINLFVDYENGFFTLGDICEDGGDRLVDASYRTAIAGVFPQPATDLMTVSVLLIETGQSVLEIADISGNVISETILDTGGAPGLLNETIDVSVLAAGSYFITLRTPTYSETKSFSVR
jgi:hypothetical protein